MKRIPLKPFSWLMFGLLIFVGVHEFMDLLNNKPIDSPWRYRFLAVCVIVWCLMDTWKFIFRKDDTDLESKKVIKFGDLKDMDSRVKPDMKEAE